MSVQQRTRQASERPQPHASRPMPEVAQALGGSPTYADDLRIQALPAAGHLLAEERPQEVAAAVGAFLR